jgi:hypothetical protein
MKDMYSNLRKKGTSFKEKKEFINSMKMVSSPVINTSFTSPSNDVDLNVALEVFAAVISEAIIQKGLQARAKHHKNKFLEVLEIIRKEDSK